MSFRNWFARRGSQSTAKKRTPKRSSRARRFNVESLESRRMLAITATFNSGVLTFAGDAAADTLNLSLDATGNANYSGTGLAAAMQTMVTSVTFDGMGGANVLNFTDANGGVGITINGANINYNTAAATPISIALTNVQTLSVLDNSMTGNDTINVQKTSVATTIGSSAGSGSDIYNVSSDAPTNGGNLAGITSALTVTGGSGINTLVISNAGGAAATATVTGTQVTGFAPVAINYSENPGNVLQLALFGSNSAATTFTVNSTLGTGNSVVLNGGSAGGNTFNIKGASADSVTINTGSGTGNTINVNANAPALTGDLAAITSAVIVDSGIGTNTLNVSNAGGTAVANVTLANGTINGVNFNQITGFAPSSISYNELAGGHLAINVQGSSTKATNFTVASTLGAGNAITLTGGAAGNNVFNIQGDSADSLTLVSGNGPTNTFNFSSDAPTNTGTTANITGAVTVTSGTGNNTLNVSNAGGLTANATLTNAQVSGFTGQPIAYTVGAGGHLAITLTGANAQSTSITVASTLGAGNTVTLNGGNAGGNTFNIQAETADTVTVNTGPGSGNTVNVSSDAPTNHGNLTGIAKALVINGGIGSNTIVVSDFGGAAAANFTLTSTQISGLTATPIAYTEVAGGRLAIDLIGADTHANTFLVTSTLGAGNTVQLVGGSSGNNQFNIGSSFATNNGQLNNIGAAVFVVGAGLNNNLEVNDHGSTGAFNYFMTAAEVITDSTTPRTYGGTFYSGVQTVQLDATDQQNQFFVGPSPVAVYTINAYKPTALPLVPVGTGDVLTIDYTGTQDAVLTKTAVPAGGNSFNGTWTFSNEQTVNFTSIEQLPIPVVVTSTDASRTGLPLVTVRLAGSDQVVSSFMAYEPSYHGGVRVAVGFFDGSGQEEIAVAPGNGHAPIVKVFDIFGNLLSSFQAYPSSLKAGFNIAAGNVENLHAGINEIDDIVTVPSRGVSEVRVFHNAGTTTPGPFSLFRDFTVWGKKFLGGSSVAVADLNLDGRGDIIVGSGSGMQPLIEAFDVTVPAASYAPFKIFYPFDISYRGGVIVSAISVGQGVPSPLIIASQGNSGRSLVRVFDGAAGYVTNSFVPFTDASANSIARTVPKVIGGRLFVMSVQATDGRYYSVREFDPIAGSVVDYILEGDPNFVGFFLA